MMLKEYTQRPYNVSILKSVEKRMPPTSNILEERWLHKLFLFLQAPATWSKWQLAVGLLVLAFMVELIWLPLGPATYLAAILYLIFSLGDWALLGWLPYTKRSFGPVGPQLFVLTLPRLGAAILSAVIALLFGVLVGLAALAIFQALGTLVYVWASLREPFALGLTLQHLTLPDWQAGTLPLRLLHLSDLHVERLTRREAQLLQMIEQTRPDVIVITGDFLNLSYVDEPLARAEVRQVLEKLSAPYGVYATLGSPPVDPRETTPSLLDGLAIRLLRDEVAVLSLPDGRRLSLLGLDCEHDLESDVSALRQLMAQTPPDAPRILLYHSPELMPQAQEYPLDLYLCGHTHGGQMRMPFYGAILTSSSLGKRYEMGHYHEQGTTLYISRGVGLEGLCAPRMRLLCEPEIILWTLDGRRV